MKEFHAFYEQLFTSDRDERVKGSSLEEALSCVLIQIIKAMNQRLIREASAEEVQRAAFQIGGLGLRGRMASQGPSFSITGMHSIQTSSLPLTSSYQQVLCHLS